MQPLEHLGHVRWTRAWSHLILSTTAREDSGTTLPSRSWPRNFLSDLSPSLTPRDFSFYLIITSCPSLFSKFLLFLDFTCLLNLHNNAFNVHTYSPYQWQTRQEPITQILSLSLLLEKKVKISCLLRPVNPPGALAQQNPSTTSLYLNGHQILKGHYSKSFVTLFKPRIPFSVFLFKKS